LPEWAGQPYKNKSNTQDIQEENSLLKDHKEAQWTPPIKHQAVTPTARNGSNVSHFLTSMARQIHQLSSPHG
jgi:hypothetical protein